VEAPLPAGHFVKGQGITIPLSLSIPPETAGTVATHNVEVEYRLEVTLEFAAGRHAKAHCTVRVLAAHEVCRRSATVPATAGHDDVVALSIENLSGREVIPGQRITGTVVAAPKQVFATKGVRVFLALNTKSNVLSRHTTSRYVGGTETVEDTKVAEAMLSGPGQMSPGDVIRLPFSLEVPMDLPGPSAQAETFRAVYVLVAEALPPGNPGAVHLVWNSPPVKPFGGFSMYGATAQPPASESAGQPILAMPTDETHPGA